MSGASFGPPAAGAAFGPTAAYYASPDHTDYGFNYGVGIAPSGPGTLKDIRDNLQPTPLAIQAANQEYTVDSSTNDIDDLNIQRMLAVYQTFGKYLFNASTFYSSQTYGLFSKSVYIHTRRGFKNKYDVILITDTSKTTPDRRINIKLLEAFRPDNNIADNPDPKNKLDNIKILNFNSNPLDFVKINASIRANGVPGRINAKTNFDLFLGWLLHNRSYVTATGPGPNPVIYYRSDIIAITEGYVDWYNENDEQKYFSVPDSDGDQYTVYISDVVVPSFGKYKYILCPEKPHSRRQRKIMCFAISKNLRRKIDEPQFNVVPIKLVSAGSDCVSYALGVIIGTTIYVVVHPQQADKTHRINYYRGISKYINNLNLQRLLNGEPLIVNIILVGDFNCLTTVINKGKDTQRNIGVYKEMLFILKEFPLFEGNWTNFNTPTITAKNGIYDGKPYDSLVILTMKKPETTFLGIELGTIEIGNKQKYPGDQGYVRTVFEAGEILAAPKANASHHRPIITLVPMSVISPDHRALHDNIQLLINEQISTQRLIELEGDDIKQITRKNTGEFLKLSEEELQKLAEKVERAQKRQKNKSKSPDVGANPDDSPGDSQGASASGAGPSGASASASASGVGNGTGSIPGASASGVGNGTGSIPGASSSSPFVIDGGSAKFGGKNKKAAKGASNPGGSGKFGGKNKKAAGGPSNPGGSANFGGKNKKTKDETIVPTKKPNKKTKDENVINILTKEMKKILKI